MKKRKKMRISKALLVLLFIGLLISINAVLLEARTCDEAFFYCYHDPWWTGFYGAIYCGIGYLYCKKYMEF